MNATTQRIKSKGYNLPEFLKKTGISLSTYRRYEKESNANHAMLNRLINELENKS
jgi:transcriptional regulator with XRE-family HTH domain